MLRKIKKRLKKLSLCHKFVTQKYYGSCPAVTQLLLEPNMFVANPNNRLVRQSFKSFSLSLIALSFTMPFAAQAVDVDIYGRAHVSVDVLGDGSDYGLNLSSNSSRIGFRANHRIHDNIEVIMQLEQKVNFDERGGEFATRDSYVGLRGNWGQVRFGSFDTPGKLLRAKADVFNDRLGDLRNIASGDNMSFDPRFRNSIHYRSPAFYNTTFDIQYSPHNETGSTRDNQLQAISVGVNYSKDRLWLGAVYEMNQLETRDPTAIRLGGSYQFTDAWQGMAFYQHASDIAFGDRDVFGGGTKYRFGDYAVMGQIYHSTDNDLDDTGATMLAVGFDFYVTKDFTLYTILGVTDNDQLAGFSVSAGGRDTQLFPELGNTASGLSMGLIYNF